MKADDLFNGRTGMAAAALLAAVGLGFSSAQTPTMAAPAGGMSEIAKLAAKGGVDAIEAMLDARSPGLRLPGALTQTKGRKVASLKDMFEPKERVLSQERTRPGSEPPAIAYETGNVDASNMFTPITPVTAPGGDETAADTNPAPPTLGPPPPGGYTPPIIVTGGGGGSGGGGGGNGGGGGDTPGGDTPGGGGAVPEPATWVSLLLGFFAIGFGLRGGATIQPARRLNGRIFQ